MAFKSTESMQTTDQVPHGWAGPHLGRNKQGHCLQGFASPTAKDASVLACRDILSATLAWRHLAIMGCKSYLVIGSRPQGKRLAKACMAQGKGAPARQAGI